MKKDYYSILGINKNATKDEIKKAFKKRAKETHPDLHKGKEAEFKEINEAYETLSDDKKRADYDNPMHCFEFNGSSFGFNPFGFEFQKMVYPGEDVHVSINLSIEDIYNLTEKTIRYSYKKRCRHCEETSNRTTCQVCQGTGFVTKTIRQGYSIMQTRGICQTCHGTGKVVKEHCGKCNDSGFTSELSSFNFNIKDYINYIYQSKELNFDVGQFGSEGSEKNSQRGNLIVNVRRDFNNGQWNIANGILCYKLNVNVFKMLTGGDQVFSLPNGKELKVNIKSCSRPNQVLTIPGHGLLKSNNERDKLYVELIPEFPKELSEKQIQILNDNFLTN